MSNCAIHNHHHNMIQNKTETLGAMWLCLQSYRLLTAHYLNNDTAVVSVQCRKYIHSAKHDLIFPFSILLSTITLTFFGHKQYLLWTVEKLHFPNSSSSFCFAFTRTHTIQIKAFLHIKLQWRYFLTYSKGWCILLRQEGFAWPTYKTTNHVFLMTQAGSSQNLYHNNKSASNKVAIHACTFPCI